jgi:hypothetical protein
MIDMQAIFTRALNDIGVPDKIGAPTVSILRDGFKKMAVELKKRGVTPEEETAFRAAISRAITAAPELDLAAQSVIEDALDSAFDGIPRPTQMLVVEAIFLARVRF